MGLFQVVDEKDFVNCLIKSNSRGKELIPLLGGGISVQSGIPVINTIEEYLKCCILMALRGNDAPAVSAPWTPSEQWPALDFFDNVPFEKSITLDEVKKNPLWMRGYGASSDWRMALDFLSRIDLDDRKQLQIVPYRSSVIDSFFRHITSGKKPNLAHRMLSVLARSGQIQLLLTVNFDELIEAAMHQAQLPLTTIALDREATLPPRESFWPELTLIKMHGGRYGLRADETLDHPPSSFEINEFRKYFICNDMPTADLLIAGASLDDQRLEKFIHSLVTGERGTRHVRIFWIYYSDSDREKAVKLCKNWEATLRRGQMTAHASSPRGESRLETQIWLHQSNDVGLLLLHYYQMLKASLPDWGVDLPDASSVPWPPSLALTELLDKDGAGPHSSGIGSTESQEKFEIESSENIPTRREAHKQQLEKAREKSSDPNKRRQLQEGIKCIDSKLEELEKEFETFEASGRPQIIAFLGEPKYQSLTEMAATLFHELADRFQTCIWIDLDNAASVDDLFEQIRSAFATKACLDDWTPGMIGVSGVDRAKELSRYVRLVPGRWNLFLNAREQAGINAPYVREFAGKRPIEDVWYETHPNGWLDQAEEKNRDHIPTSDSWDAFARLIEGIVSLGESLPLTVMLIGTAFEITDPKILQHDDEDTPTGMKAPGNEAKNESKATTDENDSDQDHRKEKTGLYKNLKMRLDRGNCGKKPESPPNEVENHIRRWDGKLIVLDAKNARFVDFEEHEVVDLVIEWLGRTESGSHDSAQVLFKKWRFLVGLTLVKHPRHRSAIYSYALRVGYLDKSFLDGTVPRIDQWAASSLQCVESAEPQLADQWIEQLEARGLIRKKPGGFLWLHSKTRERLLQTLANWICRVGKHHASVDLLETARDTYQLDSQTAVKFLFANCHILLAYWHQRLLHSSQDSFAAIDALSHYCQAAVDLTEMLDGFEANTKATKALRKAILCQITDALSDARRLLQHARTDLVSRGTSSGKCRRLDELVYLHLKKIIEGLKKLSRKKTLTRETMKTALRLRHSLFDTMSMIAREIGENPSAYKRLKQSFESIYQQHTYDGSIQPETDDELDEWKILEDIWSARDISTETIERNFEILTAHRRALLDSEFWIHWVVFQRRVATTHIATRAYYEAQISLLRVFHQLQPSTQSSDRSRSEEDRDKRKEPDLTEDEMQMDPETQDFIRFTRLMDEATNACKTLRDNVCEVPESSIPKQIVKTCHRQMQVAMSIVELLNFDDELGLKPESNEPHNDSQNDPVHELRKSAIDLGQTAHRIANRIVRHYVANQDHPEDRDNGHQQLLEEMQRLESYSASLFRLKEVRNRQASKDEFATNYRLADRALDHAVAWLEHKPASLLPRAIITLESAQISLARSSIVIKQTDDDDHWSSLHHFVTDQILSKFVDQDGKLTDEFVSRTASVGDFIRQLIGELTNEKTREWGVSFNMSSENREHSPIERREESFAISYGFLSEAAQKLQRAEQLLTSRQKSVWWVTKKWELELQRYRSEIELGVFDSSKMPVVIQNSIRRGLTTPIEHIFSEAGRMLRNDTIRFSRCLQLFTDCLLGIWLYRFQEGLIHCARYDQAYDKAIEKMKKQISDGVTRLDEMRSFNDHSLRTLKSPRRSRLTIGYLNRVVLHISRVLMCISVTSSDRL